MTVARSNSQPNGTSRGPHVSLQTANRSESSSSTLNPVESVDSVPKVGPYSRAILTKKREVPSWVKKQAPGWGEKICVPEWDEDESLTTEDGEGSDGSELSGDDEMDDYRNQNGWKVRLTLCI